MLKNMSCTLLIAIITSVFFSYHAQAANLSQDPAKNALNYPELLARRERILAGIAAYLAMMLELPLLPKDTDKYLAGTVGALDKIIEAEKKYKYRIKDNREYKLIKLRELVNRLSVIRKDVRSFRDDIAQFGELKFLQPSFYIATIEAYLNDTKNINKTNFKDFLAVLEKTQCKSKSLFITRGAFHLTLGLGLSTTRYKTRIESPLFFTYSFIQRGWSPKIGIAMGLGHNGYDLSHSYFDRHADKEIYIHPQHPNGKDRIKRIITFNWEGSFYFKQASINHASNFVARGYTPLPIGFSIGPEVIQQKKAKVHHIHHDTWRFYNLLRVQQIPD